MKEIHEFRIFKDCYHLLPQPNNAKFNGAIHVLHVSKTDPLFQQMGRIYQDSKNIGKTPFLWRVKRIYTKKELDTAVLLQMLIKSTFEPSGEECGTIYDETVACEICGANRKQTGALKLKKNSIPKKDIARTIAGEVVVSEKFVSACEKWDLKGIKPAPVYFNKNVSSHFQLNAVSKIDLSPNTIAGDNPFETSAGSPARTYTISGGHEVTFEDEVYICPKGHLIGLNVLSEAYVLNSPLITGNDFLASRQMTGVKRGLLRPEPIYLCSPTFRKMVEEEKLTGFEFEVAHIENNR